MTFILGYNLLTGDMPTNFSKVLTSFDYSVNCFNGQSGGQRNINCPIGGGLSGGIVAAIVIVVLVMILGSIGFVFYRRLKFGFGRGMRSAGNSMSGGNDEEHEGISMLPLSQPSIRKDILSFDKKEKRKEKNLSALTLADRPLEGTLLVSGVAGSQGSSSRHASALDNDTRVAAIVDPNELMEDISLLKELGSEEKKEERVEVEKKLKPSDLFDGLEARRDGFLLATGKLEKGGYVPDDGSSRARFILPSSVVGWTASDTSKWILHNQGRKETAERVEEQTITGQVLLRVNMDELCRQLECTIGERVILEDAKELLQRIDATCPEFEPPAYLE
ncbi:UNVERIFIED_CONTAM: hypothetical protein HDU68_005349 [Siphonaria sp. JEL0065]|nr:hypothetical protein HDU68_005349 [Siphonaria sp. JEL0065]